MTPTKYLGRIFLSAAVLLAFLSGCYMPADNISTHPGYQQLVSQSYRTKTELYLFQSDEEVDPYLGINDGQLGYRARTLPRFVNHSEIGRKIPNGRILDVVPVGAEFTTSWVVHSESPIREKVWFEGELRYAGKRFGRVRALFIQSNVDGRDGRLPEIDPTLAERIR